MTPLVDTVWTSVCPKCKHVTTRRRAVVSAELVHEARNQVQKAIHVAEAALDALQERDPFYADSLQDELKKIKADPSVRLA